MRTHRVLAAAAAAIALGTVAPAALPAGFGGMALAEPHDHAPPAATGIRYYIGDHVKILIYEHLEVPNEPAQNNNRRPHLIERTEFTGVYTVHENGAIVLPMLGTIEVDGSPIEDITKSIVDAFHEGFGRQAEASVLLDEREPVFFIGQNVSSGAIKYTPGMTVLHAVASTGLSDGAKGDVYVRMELMRERERQQKARGKLCALLARQIVLRTELNGETDLKPDERLVLLSSAKAAKSAIESGRQRRQAILESRKPVLESYAAEVAIATQKKAVLLSKLQIADDSVKNRQARDGALDNLKIRGDANSFFSAQVKGDLADVRMRRSEILNDISTVELELTRAQKDLVRVTAEAKVALNQEITSLDDEIFETEASLEGAQRIIEDLDNDRFRRGAAEKAPTFEVVRRTRQGPLRIKADELTELHPGDLVQIVRPDDVSMYSVSHQK